MAFFSYKVQDNLPSEHLFCPLNFSITSQKKNIRTWKCFRSNRHMAIRRVCTHTLSHTHTLYLSHGGWTDVGHRGQLILWTDCSCQHVFRCHPYGQNICSSCRGQRWCFKPLKDSEMGNEPTSELINGTDFASGGYSPSSLCGRETFWVVLLNWFSVSAAFNHLTQPRLWPTPRSHFSHRRVFVWIFFVTQVCRTTLGVIAKK